VSQASFELRESRWSEGLDTYAPTIQAFADHLAGLDYRAYTVMRLASAARHFCVWFRFGSAMPASRAPKSTFEPIRQRVSLWLGHASIQSTEIYLRADPTEKLEALAKMAPPTLQRGRFKAPDKLLAMLQDASHRKNYVE